MTLNWFSIVKTYTMLLRNINFTNSHETLRLHCGLMQCFQKFCAETTQNKLKNIYEKHNRNSCQENSWFSCAIESLSFARKKIFLSNNVVRTKSPQRLQSSLKIKVGLYSTITIFQSDQYFFVSIKQRDLNISSKNNIFGTHFHGYLLLEFTIIFFLKE